MGCCIRIRGCWWGAGRRQTIEQYHANWAFLSAGGLNEHGVFNTNEWVVDSERAMIERAEKVVVMADGSKIGRHAMCHVCRVDAVSMLITDARVEQNETLLELAEGGMKVMTAGDDQFGTNDQFPNQNSQ